MTAAATGRTRGSGHGKTPRTRRARDRPVPATGSKHGTFEDPRNEFSDEEWRDMVSTAAFYRAEARGFEGGSSEEDWYEAEAELRERFESADSDVESASTSGGVAADIETTGE